MEQKLLYRVNEAGQVLGLSRSRIYELMSSGRLPSVSIGRSRLITRQALEDFARRLVEEQDGAA